MRCGIAPILPDNSYQQVSYSALKKLGADFTEDIFSKGVVKWEGNFDCDKFSLAFHSFAQIKYHRQSFHASGIGKSIAIGEIYFYTRAGNWHAINFAITEVGLVFIEPQTGEEVFLTDGEIQSIGFVKI